MKASGLKISEPNDNVGCFFFGGGVRQRAERIDSADPPNGLSALLLEAETKTFIYFKKCHHEAI